MQVFLTKIVLTFLIHIYIQLGPQVEFNWHRSMIVQLETPKIPNNSLAHLKKYFCFSIRQYSRSPD